MYNYIIKLCLYTTCLMWISSKDVEDFVMVPCMLYSQPMSCLVCHDPSPLIACLQRSSNMLLSIFLFLWYTFAFHWFLDTFWLYIGNREHHSQHVSITHIIPKGCSNSFKTIIGFFVHSKQELCLAALHKAG